MTYRTDIQVIGALRALGRILQPMMATTNCLPTTPQRHYHNYHHLYTHPTTFSSVSSSCLSLLALAYQTGGIKEAGCHIKRQAANKQTSWVAINEMKICSIVVGWVWTSRIIRWSIRSPMYIVWRYTYFIFNTSWAYLSDISFKTMSYSLSLNTKY